MHYRLRHIFRSSFLIFMVLLYSCRTSKTRETRKDDLNQNDRAQKTKVLLHTALSYKGTAYKAGGIDKKGMDCSGLVITSFQKININLPRTSKEQSSIGIPIKESEAQAGDLLFFATSGKSKGINHVGIVTAVSVEKGVIFIHSTVKAGVMEDNLSAPYYLNSFIKAMRVY